MALIDCPECKKKISNKAEYCPNCGLPQKYFEMCNEEVEEEITCEKLANLINNFQFEYEKVFSSNEYITNSIRTKLLEKYYQYYDKFIENHKNFNDITENHVDMRIDLKEFEFFAQKMKNLDSDIDNYNDKYVEKELKENEEYFNNILKDIDEDILLDVEQRKAVVTDDDYCLLVAGAGAGKTTTMAAKVKYLVEKKNVRPEEIMLISYTNKAIAELRERINQKLNIPAKIATFHAFAFDIVKQSVSNRPEVNYTSYNIISEFIEQKIFNNKEFMRNLILFLGYYFNIPDEVVNFKSLDEYHMFKASQTYETLKNNLDEYIKQEEAKRSKYQTTLNGQKMRSASEVQISNFLYLNGIDYEYEKIYPHRIENARKEYTPDFYIKQGDKEAYIEHYALREDFTNERFDQASIVKYKKAIQDKRKLHRKYGTTLIETWSEYNDGSSLVDNLTKQLRENGFNFNKKELKEVYNDIVTTGKNKYIFPFVRFMMTFIERFKTNGFDLKSFDTLREKTKNVRSLLFLDLAEEVYNYYQNKMQEYNQVDFADMINLGEKYLNEIEHKGITLPYKYIIIDEFQDIAMQRFNFAKKLSNVTGAKVVAVGDDWQSIYAFAGSDITLFTKFLELLGSGKEMQITHTYRNSQELIDIAGNFIQKNSSQIKKHLISPKHIEEPIEIEAFDDKYSKMEHLAIQTESIIERIINEYGIDSSILIIGRYNFDKSKLIKTNYFCETENEEKIICKKYPEANITFLTAHSSKGLGFDNVILINMMEGKFGFPSQIEIDPIMKLVLKEDCTIEFAEERRLLYVALTRTKNKVYIIAPETKPSRFLLELIEDYKLKYSGKINLEISKGYMKCCPQCGYPLKKEFNGRMGLPLWICTNEPEICDFMTNSEEVMKDIFKCEDCENGYMIIKKNRKNDFYFYGCTGYREDGSGCNNIQNFY